MIPLKHLSCLGTSKPYDEKYVVLSLLEGLMSCLSVCKTEGQLLLQERHQLNVNASRLARC